MSRSGVISTALSATVPSLLVIALIEALIATRLPMPPGMTLWNLDVPKIDAPLAVFMSEALDQGRLPLWNDRLGLGFPLYAEGQIGALYPPNWVLFQLDPLDALAASRVVHLVAAGLGTGLLALRVTGSRPGAVVATSVAVLGGAIATKLEWTNMVAAYAWLPWVLLPLSRRPTPTRVGLLMAGIAWGLQALAGHPNTWLLTGIAAATLLVATHRDRGLVPRLLVFGGVGVAIGAIQLLPTLLLTTLSVRSLGLSEDDVFASAATPFDVLGFGFAQPFVRSDQNGWDIFTNWYPDGIFALLEASAFVGLPVIALAAASVTSRRARRWLVVAAVMLAIPVVAALRPSVWLDLPLLNGLRSPVRSYVVVALVLGLLGAIAIARARHGTSAWPVRLAAFAVALAMVAYVGTLAMAGLAPEAFATLYSAAVNHPSPEATETARSAAVAALASPLPIVLEIAAGVVMVALLAPRHGWAMTTARVLLVIVPLALLAPMANQIRPTSDALVSGSELATTLREYAPNRVLTIDPPGFAPPSPDRLAAAGVPDLAMFSSLDLLASDQLLDQVRDGPDADAVRALVGIDVLVTFDRPCPGHHVRQLTQDAAVVCRIDAVSAPYWLPADVVTVGDPTDSPIAPRDATIDPVRALAAVRPGEVSVELTDDLVAQVDAPAAGYVWIDRAWWPGWTVTVDGVRVRPFRALAGQLVPVDAGSHEIRLHLVPWDALIGLGAAVVATLLAASWVLRGRRAMEEDDGPAP